MKNLGKALILTASGLALAACSGEKTSPKSGTETVTETVAAAPPPKPTGPNYCHGREYNPEKPFRFVYFNLKIKKDEMTRIRNGLKAELEALKDLPQEAKAEAVEPYLAKTQILAAEVIADTLSYTAPDGRGQESRVFISSRDYSDISIDARKGTSLWSRTPEGIESFSFKDPTTETNWTENPDCSGQMSKRRKNSFTEVTWTSPQAAGGPSFEYKHCINDKCHEGQF